MEVKKMPKKDIITRSKFFIYGPGKSSVELMDELPTDFLGNAYKAAFMFPTIIPVTHEYGEMMDSHEQYETNPSPDDRLLVYVKMPMNDKSMWTTYCHIVAEHSAKLMMPQIDIYCDEEYVYFVIYKENPDEFDIIRDRMKDGIRYFSGYLSGIRKAIVDKHNQDICEILKDYIYHIRGHYLDNEPSDFRHTFVGWNFIFPTKIYEEDSIFNGVLHIFSNMQKYKYGQFSSKDNRLGYIYTIHIPRENIDQTFEAYIDYMRGTHDAIRKDSIESFLARQYGFIWFISESENNPYGFTLEESSYLKKVINDNQPAACVPMVECSMKDVKSEDQPYMIMTIGSTLSNIEGALADSSDEIITNLSRQIYYYINGIEEGEDE